MKNLRLITLIFLTLIIASCKGSHTTTIKMENPTFERDEVWQLVRIHQKEIHYGPDQEKITIQFNPESKNISGSAGCNQYFGKYSYSDPKLTISRAGATQMLCPDQIMSLEEQYLPLLNKVTSCQLTAYTLTLYQGEKAILEYEKQ